MVHSSDHGDWMRRVMFLRVDMPNREIPQLAVHFGNDLADGISWRHCQDRKRLLGRRKCASVDPDYPAHSCGLRISKRNIPKRPDGSDIAVAGDSCFGTCLSDGDNGYSYEMDTNGMGTS